MKDYEEILGVSPNSETEVIAAAYKALMRKYHPDTNKSGDAAAKAQEINEAYETLKDPELRRQYDERRQGADQRQGSSPPPPPPKSAAGNDSGPSGNIILTSDGALRVWLGRVDKRDSQTLQVLIQDCFSRSSHGSRGFIRCGVGTDRAAAAA